MMHGYVEWKEWVAADFGRFTPDEARYYAQELSASGIDDVRGLRIGELGLRQRRVRWVCA